MVVEPVSTSRAMGVANMLKARVRKNAGNMKNDIRETMMGVMQQRCGEESVRLFHN